ncbi:P-loop containing nucleoside triphosphate hydrolase protein [Thelephora ganbajun]|uniref:P-loop containing nucleoside triphosphate hydrolase protein n=1 Tax=Thelephora ganbajun TaxID=370292 RepID=A0ACB6ZB84_THEGA|nr:P-loop containing nucleoside triphosphate hydrolase protein [Thelephora ganbajun]
MQFWKPGTVGPGSLLDRASETEDAILSSAPMSVTLSLQAQRQQLPIFQHRDKLLRAIETHAVLIVVGQTGCGKTTQLPQYLYEAGWAAGGSVIACTQPRRVAATSVATRVAVEVGTILGEEVGYTIRFEDVSDKNRTRIRYMTDGVLFREALIDPLLSRYSVIMIDEAHERSVYTDLLLGVIKKIRHKRPALRLIVSSATIDAAAFLEYFSSGSSPGDIMVASLEGRMYPVEVAYLREPTSDYVQTAAEVVNNIHTRNAPGDILVFLTGREEIERCLQYLSEIVPQLPQNLPALSALPLYSGLGTAEQLQVFAPTQPGTRKVIIATNIAETSVTINGIKYVVDCGFVKLRAYNPTTLLSSLSTVKTSAASAAQRAGRAGRTSSGFCYRLYPPFVLESLPINTSPELTRTDLTTPILQLKSLGIDDLMKFDWVTSPPAESVLRALEGLVTSGMLDADGRLTNMGEKVSECPIEVNIARMLFASQHFRCGDEVLSIAAMTTVQVGMNQAIGLLVTHVFMQDVFVIADGAPGALAELERRKFTAEEGDHLTLLNGIPATPDVADAELISQSAYNAFVKYGKSSSWCRSRALSFRAMSRAVSIRSQLKKYMHRFHLPIESCNGDARRLRQCLVAGHWRNSAQWCADGTYVSVYGKIPLHVHPNSVLFTRKPKSGWVIYHEMEETKKKQIRVLTEIEPEWYVDIFFHLGGEG